MGTMAMDAGQMSARLDLDMRTTTGDGQGGVVTEFTPLTTFWARVEPLAIVEEERADEAVFTVTHRIWIRFRTDISPGMRFRKGTRTFMVRGFFDPDETHRYLVCRCTEEGL